jgi:hypothetical protein
MLMIGVMIIVLQLLLVAVERLKIVLLLLFVCQGES